MAIFRRLPYDIKQIDYSSIDWSTLELPRYGTNGSDTLRGGVGRDHFYGSGGNDTFFGNGGTDTFDGGDDIDTVDYSTTAEHEAFSFAPLKVTGVFANLETGEGGETSALEDSFIKIENVTGSNFNDALFGNSQVNVLRGLNGDDFIEGGAGGDTLIGDGGSDTVSYISSNQRVVVNLLNDTASGGHATGDTIVGFENIFGSMNDDTLTGDEQDNTIEGGLGRDTMDGSTGLNDTVSYSISNAGVTVNLQRQVASGGHATGDTIRGFENVIGSEYGDVLTGSSADNTFTGLGGDDVMTGGGGVDTFVFNVNATTGDDHITDFTVPFDRLVFDVTDPTVDEVAGDWTEISGGRGNLVFDLGNGDTLTVDNITQFDAGVIQLFGITYV